MSEPATDRRPDSADPALPATGEDSARWLERYAGSVMATYGRPQRVLVRGEGCWVWDADGRRYLDLLGGIAANDARPRPPAAGLDA